MVYRGKPSAGCESCRRSKKRCTLEQPACARCVKLKKPCVGYRDTDSLQVQDESEAVRVKVHGKARRTAQAIVAAEDALARQSTQKSTQTPSEMLTPNSNHTDSSSGSGDMEQVPNSCATLGPWYHSPITYTFSPTADDVAKSHFINQFTSPQHWSFLRDVACNPKMNPCLDLAIKACGMAAMDNVENMGGSLGREYARAMYADALGLLNATLRDPRRCKTDDALMAVIMLGYFENLICDSRESIQSWKAHIAGATQLLKLRGKAQFESRIGRVLFREIRSQILVHCIWDDLEPPPFLSDWDAELEAASTELQNITKPVDTLAKISFDFAKVRAAIEKGTISDVEAADVCAKCDERLINWELEAKQKSAFWRYHEVEVADSPHIWNGMVHAYRGAPAPAVWSTFRSVRILVTRSQEYLASRFHFDEEEREEQRRYFRRVRRQMTDDICAGIPACLGQAPDGVYNSQTILLSAYSSIWPLFFAGTCALERIGPSGMDNLRGATPHSHSASNPHDITPDLSQISAAQAQVSWIWGRLNHISSVVGLKWASGIAGVLQGDFRLHDDLLPSDGSLPVHPNTWDAMRTTSWSQRARMAHEAREEGRHKPWHGCVGYAEKRNSENSRLLSDGSAVPAFPTTDWTAR